jgi:hypothetical protein
MPWRYGSLFDWPAASPGQGGFSENRSMGYFGRVRPTIPVDQVERKLFNPAPEFALDQSLG